MTATPPDQSTPALIPTISAIRACAQEVFHVRPCLWQIEVAKTLLEGGKDVLCIAGTGMGETLTFWLLLLFRPDGIQIIVTPLNLLGKQNVAALTKARIPAIAISSETATPANFHATEVEVTLNMLGHPHSEI
ncbi:hypothetical protein JVU11DRAFT_7332 [Chiua virens]|nr:hypothetical protein JVU11DRAFT_7332 [Chiua virens]